MALVIALLCFFLVAGLLGARHWLAIHHIKALAANVGGVRMLSRGSHAVETKDCVVELTPLGWRVEVPRVRLGRRLMLTLSTQISAPGLRTGFAEIDAGFRVNADDEDLAVTVCADPRVRETLLLLAACIAIVRIDLIVGEKLIVSGRLRRRVAERAALDAVVAFARAVDDQSDIKATVSAGSRFEGGVGGASGSPFAMQLR